MSRGPMTPVYISPWFYDSVDAGTWAIALWPAAKARAGYLYNSTHADQDAISYKDYMPAGTYTLKVLSDTNTNRGILKVKIDGVTVLTKDCYSGSVVHNVITTQTGISVATSGVKTIQCIVDGKNGSSSDHYMVLAELVFYRTA